MDWVLLPSGDKGTFHWVNSAWGPVVKWTHRRSIYIIPDKNMNKNQACALSSPGFTRWVLVLPSCWAESKWDLKISVISISRITYYVRDFFLHLRGNVQVKSMGIRIQSVPSMSLLFRAVCLSLAVHEEIPLSAVRALVQRLQQPAQTHPQQPRHSKEGLHVLVRTQRPSADWCSAAVQSFTSGSCNNSCLLLLSALDCKLLKES